MIHRNDFNPDIDALLALLCERFPRCFVRHEARRRPLKVGIDKDILAAFDGAVTLDELGKALSVYVGNKVYRARLKTGTPRIDLDGNPVGIVTPQQATPYVDRQPKPPRPLPSTSPPITKRASLADLRAAAQQRKAKKNPGSSDATGAMTIHPPQGERS